MKRRFDDDHKLRTVIFRPYRKDQGPWFVLELGDTFRTDSMGKSILSYRLTQAEIGKPAIVIFDGADFHCSPMYAIDSDQALRSLIGFLTLRQGDTDAEYFAEYTPEQLDFIGTDAEELSMWSEEEDLEDVPFHDMTF